MTQSIRCVVFDLDDTLYLERDYVRSGFKAVGRFLEERFRVEGFFPKAWEEFEAGHRGDIFDRALRQVCANLEGVPIQRLVEVYREHDPELSLEKDAKECLDELHGEVSMALVTDGPLASQKGKVRSLELSRWIDHMIFTAELGPGLGKPHPRAFEMIQELTGFNAKACIYVADNPLKDFSGPKRLGWRTLRIRRAQGLHSHRASGKDVGSESTRLIARSLIRGN